VKGCTWPEPRGDSSLAFAKSAGIGGKHGYWRRTRGSKTDRIRRRQQQQEAEGSCRSNCLLTFVYISGRGFAWPNFIAVLTPPSATHQYCCYQASCHASFIVGTIPSCLALASFSSPLSFPFPIYFPSRLPLLQTRPRRSHTRG
jgi:hypothetical protein